MESQIRLVLLVVGALIILAILFDGLRRQRKQKKISHEYLSADDQAYFDDENENENEVCDEGDIDESAHRSFEDEYDVNDVNEAFDEYEDEEEDEALVDESFHDSEVVTQEVKDIIFSVEQQAQEMLSSQKAVEQDDDFIQEEECDQLSDIDEYTDESSDAEVMPHELDSASEDELAPDLDVDVQGDQTDNLKKVLSKVKTDFDIPKEKPDRLIIFTLIADDEELFGGFNLLRVLLENNFYHGDMKVFNYHDQGREDGKVLFSLAAATKTGEIDVTNMARFSCKGLVVFMHTKDHTNPAVVFDEMIEKTRLLARSLNAELRINSDKAWTDGALNALRDSFT